MFRLGISLATTALMALGRGPAPSGVFEAGVFEAGVFE
jgi:hypothetical protein